MWLKDILYKTAIETVIGSTNIPITHLHFDSRQLSADSVFVAVKGTLVDGHHFIDKALEKGAKAIVCEQLPKNIEKDITYVTVKSTPQALAYMSANWYDNPSCNLNLIGITGTNGKTTIASLLFQLFKTAGYKVGLISTIEIKVNDTTYKTSHTTPNSLIINKYLAQMCKEKVTHCFMEVSSHGIHQSRTKGLHFKGGVFTNLSHDHLNYHKTFAAYRDTKKLFFDQLPKTAFALTNLDDKNGTVILQNCVARKKTYAFKTYANYKGQILEQQFDGLLLKMDEQEVWVKLIGDFNAYNLLAVYAVSVELGLEKLETLRFLSQLKNITGRFEYYIAPQKIAIIVDYAHTPDALKNILHTINKLRTGNEKVITVVGCGGDRDKSKRPIMGDIAATLSNRVIFTSDNPRTENPYDILKEIESGVGGQFYYKIRTIEDRKQAIKVACQLAEEGDIVLIAGKGHETYQEIQGKKHDFDDMKMVKKFIKELNK